MANWSEIPDDIVEIFSKRLPPYAEEFACFSSVCKLWNSLAIKEKPRFIRCAPWVMLSKKDNDDDSNGEQGIRSFYSLSSKRIFNIKLPTQGRRCWGTPYGWVVTMGLDLNIHLLNPLSGNQLSLPPQSTFEEQYPPCVGPHFLCRLYIIKFVLTSNPSFLGVTAKLPQPLVMAVHGEFCKLAFASPGDDAWTTIENPPGGATDDVIFFKDHFYSIGTNGELRICDIKATPPTASEFSPPPNGINITDTFYLVEMFGELHLVARAFTSSPVGVPWHEYHHETKHFYVLKFDFHTKTWTEVSNLGDHAFFVGNNSSCAISTSEFPEFKGNCIYFTDDHYDLYEHPFCDMGVYDMKEDIVEPIYFIDDELSRVSRPLFFMPNLF